MNKIKYFLMFLGMIILVSSFLFVEGVAAEQDEEIQSIGEVLMTALPEVFDGDKGFAAGSTFGMSFPTAGEGVFTRVSDFQRDVLFNQVPAPIIDGDNGNGGKPPITPSFGVTPPPVSIVDKAGNIASSS